jgi:hypothetical protein
MNLTRNSFEISGIYGTLTSEDGTFSCVTLEHAFLQDDGSYAPITPPGTYTCQLGMHSLDHIPAPFKAYQIMNVPGHSGVLIHMGNYNKDSDGCCLVGAERVGDMINSSRVTFDKLMESLNNIDSFTLIIS